MLWVETYLTYENMVAAANIIATISIGAALIYNKIKTTKMTLLKNTDIVNNVNATIQPVLSKVVAGSITNMQNDVRELRAETRKLLQATVLALTNDAESRLAAIKLLGELTTIDQPTVVKAEQIVVEEIKEEVKAEQQAEKQTEVINTKIDAIVDTL